MPGVPGTTLSPRGGLVLTLAIGLSLLAPARASLAAGRIGDASTSAPVERVGAPPAGDSTAIEYGLIAALVAVVVIGALTTLGTALDDKFSTVAQPVGSGEDEPPPEGGEEKSEEKHEPGGKTQSSAGIDFVFQNGGYVHSATSASSYFENLYFEFHEDAAVVNAAAASERPNVKLIHELVWTLTLRADPPQGPPPSENAVLRMDFAFSSLAWGIGGPVPLQDGVFEIEGPDGTTWGWTMEKNVQTGMLEITSTDGPKVDAFVFDGGPDPVNLQGLDFQPEEVLRGVGPDASFTFEIPYGVATDVTFKIRRLSHTVVADLPAPVPVPTLSRAGGVGLALSLALLGGWRARARSDGARLGARSPGRRPGRSPWRRRRRNGITPSTSIPIRPQAPRPSPVGTSACTTSPGKPVPSRQTTSRL